MSQYIEHDFVMTGNEDAINAVLSKLENLKKNHPDENGVMEWGKFERTDGQLEFSLMDSHYFETKVLTPKLMEWGKSENIVTYRYSWTDDGDLAAWTVRIEGGESEVIADWDWPHPVEIQIGLLSFSDSPTPEKTIQMLKFMSENIDLYSGYVPSCVGIAEVLLMTFKKCPELLDDTNVQAAIRDIEEQNWSDDEVEDMLPVSTDAMEPLFQFYRLRESLMIR